jgi:hypothetical protein
VKFHRLKWHGKNYLHWLSFNKKRLVKLFVLYNMFLAALYFTFFNKNEVKVCALPVNVLEAEKAGTIIYDLLQENVNYLENLRDCQNEYFKLKEETVKCIN